MVTDVEIFREIAPLLERGKKAALCTIIEKVGSAPRDVGAKMVVLENGRTFGTIGGGNMERALVDAAIKVLKEGKSQKMMFALHKGKTKGAIATKLICGGELTIFVDVVQPKQRLIIIGAGHIAWPLAKLADIIGFNITVIDDNDDLANKEWYPMAEKIITGNFSEALDKVELSSNDIVVIVHGEPEHDYIALEKTVKKRPAYIGLLGSKTKVTILRQRLKTAGVKEQDLKTLHAPIGLDIYAQTPEEIGISILAEIIQERRK